MKEAIFKSVLSCPNIVLIVKPHPFESINETKKYIKESPNKIIYASDRNNLNAYERAGRELISKGLAYVYFERYPQEFVYGKSIEENIDMYDYIIGAGNGLGFVSAGVLLGIPNDMRTLNILYSKMNDSEIKIFIKKVLEK